MSRDSQMVLVMYHESLETGAATSLVSIIKPAASFVHMRPVPSATHTTLSLTQTHHRHQPLKGIPIPPWQRSLPSLTHVPSRDLSSQATPPVCLHFSFVYNFLFVLGCWALCVGRTFARMFMQLYNSRSHLILASSSFTGFYVQSLLPGRPTDLPCQYHLYHINI